MLIITMMTMTMNHDYYDHDHDYEDHDKNAHHVILPGQLGGDQPRSGWTGWYQIFCFVQGCLFIWKYDAKT